MPHEWIDVTPYGTAEGVDYGEDELDDRYEWIEIYSCGEPGPRYVRGMCRHLEIEPVISMMGERVAGLCLTCDMQLPHWGY